MASKGKGLRVFLTVGSNQPSQEGTIKTTQYGQIQDLRYQYINHGSFEYELRYQKDQIDNGNFQICITLENGINNCSDGYDGPEKKPVYMHINLHGETNDQQDQGSQAQSQSSSNENTNENSLSQSQATTIIICNDGKCKQQ